MSADVEARSQHDDRPVVRAPRTLGRYRIIAELGRGSTSIVYLAAIAGPSGYRKLVALKVLRAALAVDPPAVAMFIAEARIGALLNHPNVVSTLEIEERETLPFIVMEFLDGEPLQRVLTSARMAFAPLPLHMHLAALSGALEGLAHAHAAVGPDGAPLHVVHRDVSPHNVFITNTGTPKLLDFGFAQAVDSPNTMLSSAARVAYMSPEQADREVVDARSDLFSIGVMAWEAVTRRRFWPEETSQAEILRALRSRDFPAGRVDALAKSPERLRAMTLKATAPDPDDRYATAAAFQAELRVALGEIAPAFAPHDLGHRVTTLFAADRARLQRAIDEDGAEFDKTDSTASAPEPWPIDEPPTRPSIPPIPPIPSPPPPVAFTPVAFAPVADSPRRPSMPPSLAPPPPIERASEPLPSFPLPSVESDRTRRRTYVAVASGVGVMFLLGLGLSLLLNRRDAPTAPDVARSSPAAASAPAATAATAAASTVATAGAPSLEPASEPTPRASAPPATPPTRAEAAPVDGTPRGHSPARARALPSVTVVVEPTPSKAPTAGGGGETEHEVPIHASETGPAPARPPHPIDSVNPYGR